MQADGIWQLCGRHMAGVPCSSHPSRDAGCSAWAAPSWTGELCAGAGQEDGVIRVMGGWQRGG